MALIRESSGEGDLRQSYFDVAELSSGKFNPKPADILADRLTNLPLEGRRQVHGVDDSQSD
jgi:hypothetical protein